MSDELNYSIDFAADGTDLTQPLNKDDIIVAKLDVKAGGVPLTKEQAESKVIRFYDYDEDGTNFNINTPSTVFAPTMEDEDGEDIVFSDVAIATATSEMNGKKIRISLQEKVSEGTPTELFHRDVTLAVNDTPVQGVTVDTPFITIGKRQDKQIVVLNTNVTTDRTDVVYQWLKDGTPVPDLTAGSVILDKAESNYGTYQLVVKYNQKHGRYRKEVRSDSIVLNEESFAERTNVSVEGSSSSDTLSQPGVSSDTHASEETHTDTAHTEDNTHVEPGRTDGDTHAADSVPGTSAGTEEHHDAEVTPSAPPSSEPAHAADNTGAATGKEEKPAGSTDTQPVSPAPSEEHHDTPVVTPSQPSADNSESSVPAHSEPSAPADNTHAEAGSQPAVGADEHHDETSHTTEQPQGTPSQPPVAPEHHDETTHNTEGNPSVSGTTETQPVVPEKRGIKLRHTNLGILREGTPLEIEAVATPEERGYELAQCQWMNIKDGVATPLAGQNTATLNIVIGPEHGNIFYLTAYNGPEFVMSEHAKATHIEYKDVEIIVKPETQLLNKVEGDALDLEVTAIPSDHVVFRWKKEVNGQETSVEGGTQNTLHIEPLRLTDAGDYFIEGERLGKVFARRKVSTVEVAPRKVEVPFNPVLDKSGELSEAIGKIFTLTVTEPNATENTVYSWYRTPVGGQPALLPGQNTNVLTISDLKVSDAGVYYVEVSETNRAPVRSAAVTLNVIPEPETLKPQPPVPGTDGTTGDSSTTDPYDGSKVQGDAFGYKHTLTNLSVATFRQYAQMMNPASRIDPLTGLEWQIRLYETLMTILKTDSIDVYMEAMDAAVDFFYTYSGSLFAMENRARFLQYATDSRLPKDSREALLELFNVFYTMGNPGGPEDRWDLKEIKDILRNSVAYARLSQYYDRKYKAMKSAEISGRVRNFI